MLKMNEHGIFLTREFDNGRVADVFAILYGKARIGLSGRLTRWCYDRVW